MRGYLGGPMRGHPQQNASIFKEAAIQLRVDDWEIVSPIEHEDEIGFDYVSDINSLDSTSLGWDLAQVADPSTEAIILLPGWEQSEGTLLERHVAQVLHKPVFYFDWTDTGYTLTLERLGDPRFHRVLRDIGSLPC